MVDCDADKKKVLKKRGRSGKTPPFSALASMVLAMARAAAADNAHLKKFRNDGKTPGRVLNRVARENLIATLLHEQLLDTFGQDVVDARYLQDVARAIAELCYHTTWFVDAS